MTNERKAGRELDAEIAEKVMGWGWVGRIGSKWFAPLSTIGDDRGDGFPVREALDCDLTEQPWWLDTVKRFDDCEIVPAYSTDIAAAFLVVEKMRASGYPRFHLMAREASARYPGWRADFEGTWREAETASRAICLAALAALAPLEAVSVKEGER